MNLVLVLAIWLTASAASAAPPQSTVLGVGSPVDRSIAAGESQTFDLRIDRDQAALVEIDADGIGVELRVSEPNGDTIAQFTDLFGGQGRGQMAVAADSAGPFLLIVSARRWPSVSGSYTLRLTGLRQITPSDRERLQAMRLRAEVGRAEDAGNTGLATARAAEALAAAERASLSDSDLALFTFDLARVYQNGSDRQKAQPLYERTLPLLERSVGPDHPRTATVVRQLASFRTTDGDYVQADAMLHRALEIHERALGPDDPQVGLTLRNLGYLLERRGDLTKAEEVDLRALAILEKAEGRTRLLAGDVLNNLGVIYLARRDYRRAGEYLERALPPAEAFSTDDLYVANILQNLGIVAREAKDYAKAEAYYLRALASRERSLGPEHADIAANLINLANIYRAKGDYPRALETHLRSLAMFERTVGPSAPFLLLSLVNVARTYAVLGDLANAVKYQTRLEQATETAIALNLSVGSDRQRVAYLTPIAERTERTLSLNLQMTPGDPDSTALAVTVLLQRKGRVIDASVDIQAALRRNTDAESRALLDQLNEIVGQLARLVLNGPQTTPLEDYRKAIAALEERKEQLESQIGRRSAEFRATSAPVTLEAVQAAMPANAALIEFAAYRPFDPAIDSVAAAFGKLRYAAYVVRRTGPPSGVDLGDAEAIDKAVAALRGALGDPSRSDVRRLSRALDDAVMRPLRLFLGDSIHLLISPDGALNLVPFEALLDDRGRYLVQRYRCTYLTSGRDLLRMQVARKELHGPLIVANPAFGDLSADLSAGASAKAGALAKAEPITAAPAPSAGPTVRTREPRRSVTSARDLSEVYFAPIAGTAREAQAIQRLFPEATVLEGERASESSLRQVAAPRLLHIATHGFFLQYAGIAPKPGAPDSAGGPGRDPLLRSGLALARANVRGNTDPDDGVLTALEASRLNLWGTRLVALSACDTGVGEVRNGDGVYGLRRAFVLAGAESLLMSLWPVSDTWTERQMRSYYQHLTLGKGRGESLRLVQLDMLARNPRLHPFYWANFIQSGDWAPLDRH
jgi:CHAT domain-containing protein/Tfp pilus assembly protein PilF